ncbi:MAG: cell division protein FtsQ/DivIB [Gammaproteobacteria bacterium]|nr:cell division protein FtsQ/DivIB [Gammaproteobacteria bacterium]
MPRPKRPPLQQTLAAFMQVHFSSLTGLLLLVLLAISVMQGVAWLQDPYRFPLRVVEIEGELRYLQKQPLQQSLAPHLEGGFFSVDVAGVRDVIEGLPWVYQARVQRVWPDILSVTIEEQDPIARWGEDGLLNRYGEAFVPGHMPELIGLPRLAGPPGHEQTVLEQYQAMAKTLAALGMQVARVELDERRAWHVGLANGVQLELGRTDSYRRLQRFVRSYRDVFAARLDELRRVDLRYSNGFSVDWREALMSAEEDKG